MGDVNSGWSKSSDEKKKETIEDFKPKKKKRILPMALEEMARAINERNNAYDD